MSIEIQVLGRGQAQVLARVAPGVFDDPIHPPAAEAFLADPRHHLAVALEAGLVVGFASAVHYLHPDKPQPEMWINEVGVASSQRGRGIGRAVLLRLLDTARELGCAEAWVLTDRKNGPARRLYHSVGGEEVREEALMFSFRLAGEGA